jgi:hypothetical protein
MTRRMISMGQGDPAMAPVRSDVTSVWGRFGWFRMSMNMVGVPYRAVHLSGRHFKCKDVGTLFGKYAISTDYMHLKKRALGEWETYHSWHYALRIIYFETKSNYSLKLLI